METNFNFKDSNIHLPESVTNANVFFESLYSFNLFNRFVSKRYDDDVIGTFFSVDTPSLLYNGKNTWLNGHCIFRSPNAIDAFENNFKTYGLKITPNESVVKDFGYGNNLPGDIVERIITVVKRYLSLYGKTISDCIFPNIADQTQYINVLISKDNGVVYLDPIKLYTGEKFKKVEYASPKYRYAHLEPIAFLTGYVNYYFE